MVYDRHARFFKELHRLRCTVTTQMLLQTKSPILCVEDLQLTARSTREALAKAILNMPDQIDLYERAILLIFYLTGVITVLRRVDPRNTSHGVHVGCPVYPAGQVFHFRDAFDVTPCSTRGVLVNTHTNVVCLIRDKRLSHFSPLSSNLLRGNIKLSNDTNNSYSSIRIRDDHHNAKKKRKL